MSRLVQIPLKPHKNLADIANRPKLTHRITYGVVFQFDQLWQLVWVKFRNATLNVVIQHKPQKFVLAVIILAVYAFSVSGHALRTRYRW